MVWAVFGYDITNITVKCRERYRYNTLAKSGFENRPSIREVAKKVFLVDSQLRPLSRGEGVLKTLVD